MSAGDEGPCRDCGFTRGDRQVLLSTLAEYEGDYEAMRMRLADAEEELATAMADNAGLMREIEILRSAVEGWRNAAYTLNDKLNKALRAGGAA